MTRRRPALAAAAITIAPVLLSLPTGPAEAAPGRVAAEDAGADKLLLMLDSSGSMAEPDASGSTKMQAARSALHSVIDRLAAGQQAGLRVYGATVRTAAKGDPRACTDTQLKVPVGPADKAALKAAVDGSTPTGDTPIAYSLQQAVKDLGPTGRRHIVLVSDGEESCSPDPCPAIKELVGQGVDLRIDTVGLGVGDAARTQLQCVADAGHGGYYDARDAASLTEKVDTLANRQLRPWKPSGSPVQGTAMPGGAPALRPGTYQDTFSAQGEVRHYLVDRDPSGTTSLSVTGKAVKHESSQSEGLKITWSLPDGRTCGDTTEHDSAWHEIGTFITTRVVLDPDENGRDVSADDDCRAARQLVAAVKREPVKKGAPMPVELLVQQEKGVTVTDGLPEAFKETRANTLPRAPRAATVRPVRTGVSAQTATEVTTGSYSDVVTTGEEVVYKVRLGWGQRVVATAEMPQVPFESYLKIGVRNPQFSPVDPFYDDTFEDDQSLSNDAPVENVVSASTPQVRYLNRKDGGRNEATSEPGWYYVVVSAANGYFGSEEKGPTGIPFTLHVQVDGQPGADPAYAPAGSAPSVTPTGPSSSQAPSTTTSAPPSTSTTSLAAPATSAEGGSRTPLMVGGGVLVMALVGAGAFLMGRRTRG